jgi:hypothetical protein
MTTHNLSYQNLPPPIQLKINTKIYNILNNNLHFLNLPQPQHKPPTQLFKTIVDIFHTNPNTITNIKPIQHQKPKPTFYPQQHTISSILEFTSPEDILSYKMFNHPPSPEKLIELNLTKNALRITNSNHIPADIYEILKTANNQQITLLEEIIKTNPTDITNSSITYNLNQKQNTTTITVKTPITITTLNLFPLSFKNYALNNIPLNHPDFKPTNSQIIKQETNDQNPNKFIHHFLNPKIYTTINSISEQHKHILNKTPNTIAYRLAEILTHQKTKTYQATLQIIISEESNNLHKKKMINQIWNQQLPKVTVLAMTLKELFSSQKQYHGFSNRIPATWTNLQNTKFQIELINKKLIPNKTHNNLWVLDPINKIQNF